MKRILALWLAAVLLAAVFQLAIPVVRIPVIALVQERNTRLASTIRYYTGVLFHTGEFTASRR